MNWWYWYNRLQHIFKKINEWSYQCWKLQNIYGWNPVDVLQTSHSIWLVTMVISLMKQSFLKSKELRVWTHPKTAQSSSNSNLNTERHFGSIFWHSRCEISLFLIDGFNRHARCHSYVPGPKLTSGLCLFNGSGSKFVTFKFGQVTFFFFYW